MNNLMSEQPDEHHSVEWTTTRPIVSGLGGVISSGHPLVSMAGMRMLLSGGNAFDAAAAAGFAAAVIEPTASYTLCGECVAMVHDARSDRTVVLSGQGPAPALATIATLAKNGFPRIATGPGPNAHLSFTVPGAVDAYLTLLETFGTRTIAEVLAPSLEYAEQGFPMYEYMRRMLSIPETRTQFALYPPGGEAVFYPAGRVPRVGELFRQPALAGTLKKLIAAGTPSGGDRLAGIRAVRERFYGGDIAATIGAFSCCAPLISRAIARGSRSHSRRPLRAIRFSANPRGRRRRSSCKPLGCSRPLI
jgi:gamma-glutamyltranspeptidase / glutathione hydrolase